MNEHDSGKANSYGFGIDHPHPHLQSVFSCIRDELLLNKLYPLKVSQFHQILIKAIKIHGVATSDTYKHDMICKYYNIEYNIKRNEPIGIRHILSLIVYTDITSFCTEFRKTYRRIDDEIKDEQVVERHMEFYHYARALYV